jgi:hypothetical protein
MICLLSRIEFDANLPKLKCKPCEQVFWIWHLQQLAPLMNAQYEEWCCFFEIPLCVSIEENQVPPPQDYDMVIVDSGMIGVAVGCGLGKDFQNTPQMHFLF